MRFPEFPTIDTHRLKNALPWALVVGAVSLVFHEELMGFFPTSSHEAVSREPVDRSREAPEDLRKNRLLVVEQWTQIMEGKQSGSDNPLQVILLERGLQNDDLAWVVPMLEAQKKWKEAIDGKPGAEPELDADYKLLPVGVNSNSTPGSLLPDLERNARQTQILLERAKAQLESMRGAAEESKEKIESLFPRPKQVEWSSCGEKLSASGVCRTDSLLGVEGSHGAVFVECDPDDLRNVNFYGETISVRDPEVFTGPLFNGQAALEPSQSPHELCIEKQGGWFAYPVVLQ